MEGEKARACKCVRISKCWLAVAAISYILLLPEGMNGSPPGWQHGWQDEIGVGEQLLSSCQLTVPEI